MIYRILLACVLMVLNHIAHATYYDSETLLNYNYHRDFDPGTGRYIQSDPIGLEGGLNTYSYGGSDPVGSTDEFGLSKGSSPASVGRMNAPYPSQFQSYANATAQVYLNQIRQLQPSYPPTLSPSGGIQWTPSMLQQLRQTLVRLRQQTNVCYPSAIVTSGGLVLPIPQGAGLAPTFSYNTGMISGQAFSGGQGGAGLASNVTTLRLMNPTAPNAASPGYPTGYASYQAGSQVVNPFTGQSIPPSDPWWHIPNLYLPIK